MSVTKQGLKWLTGWSGSQKTSSGITDQVVGENLSHYRPVKTASELMITDRRQRLVSMLRENSPLSDQVVSAWCIRPLEQLSERVQDVPASWSGPFSGPGGFIDLSLEVAVRAVRLTRGLMLPPGSTPKIQSEQTPGWFCAVYWAALFHHLDWLNGIEGETDKGQPWYPALGVPTSSWRIRPREEESSSGFIGMYVGCKLLPISGVLWLQRWPALSSSLFTYLNGAKVESGILHCLINDARVSCGLDVTTQNFETPSVSPEKEHMNSSAEAPRLSGSEDNLLSSKYNVSIASAPITLSENHYNGQHTEVNPPFGYELVSTSGTSEKVLEEPGHETQKTRDENYISPLLSMQDMVTIGGDTAEVIQPSPEQYGEGKQAECGEHFLLWLKHSMNDGTLSINKSDSLVHIIGDFVFLISPACFYRYMVGHIDIVQSKYFIQRKFEALNIHYSRKGKGLFHYHKYELTDKKRRHTRVSGYMIKSGVLFKQGTLPESSTWLLPRI